MDYQIVEPPQELTHLVRYFWTLEAGEGTPEQRTIKTIVDDSTGIIVQHSEGESAFENQHGILPKIFVYGHSTHPTITKYAAGFRVSGVALKPGALHAITGANAFEFTNAVVELCHFNRTLDDSILESAGRPGSIRGLSVFLNALAPKANRPTPMLLESLAIITERKGNISVSELLKLVASSERNLERIFKEAIGIPPSLFIRIKRFQEALRRIRSGQHQKLSDIALDTGYYDQPHFIKEFKTFSGYSPKIAGEEIKELLLNLQIG